MDSKHYYRATEIQIPVSIEVEFDGRILVENVPCDLIWMDNSAEGLASWCGAFKIKSDHPNISALFDLFRTEATITVRTSEKNAGRGCLVLFDEVADDSSLRRMHFVINGDFDPPISVRQKTLFAKRD